MTVVLDDWAPVVVPITTRCICGAPATHGKTITLVMHGRPLKALFPGCESCIKLSVIAGVAIQLIPTHEPVQVDRVSSYPPSRGEVFDGAAPAVGCPGCGQVVGLDTRAFRLDATGLHPSFICPHCELHAWLQFHSTAPEAPPA